MSREMILAGGKGRGAKIDAESRQCCHELVDGWRCCLDRIRRRGRWRSGRLLGWSRLSTSQYAFSLLLQESRLSLVLGTKYRELPAVAGSRGYSRNPLSPCFPDPLR